MIYVDYGLKRFRLLVAGPIGGFFFLFLNMHQPIRNKDWGKRSVNSESKGYPQKLVVRVFF
jgi:hypothetical protein